MIKMPGRITGFALNHLFKKPSTIAYPAGPLKLEPQYRGRLYYDSADCIGCNMCVRDCPARAIKITNIGTKEDKKFKMDYDIGRCIFCMQCIDSCPKDCIKSTTDIELATFNRDDLKKEML